MGFVRNDFPPRFYQLNLLSLTNPPPQPCVGLHSGTLGSITRAVGIGHRYKHLQGSVPTLYIDRADLPLPCGSSVILVEPPGIVFFVRI